jgi:hypothetical protein
LFPRFGNGLAFAFALLLAIAGVAAGRSGRRATSRRDRPEPIADAAKAG